jgi:exonuclease SbcC
MPEDNEKIEDFISLWKKKMAKDDKTPSVIGDTLNKLELLQQENEQLRKKITENIELISRSEDIIKRNVEEKEKFRLEKEQATRQLSVKLKESEQENLELSNKVKSMVKLLLEKDEEIKEKENEINLLKKNINPIQSQPQTLVGNVNTALVEELQSELSKKKSQIAELQTSISELKQENEALLGQQVEKLKSLPIDYVVPVENVEPSAIRPLPPETSLKPLELLCQDLQSDLNKYKKVIEKLNQEKSQMKQALEDKGFKFNTEELELLKKENENLKRELNNLQEDLKKKIQKKEIPRDLESKLAELEVKLSEKEDIITQLKLSQPTQNIDEFGSMAGLIENLQSTINKLKITLHDKDQKILELNKLGSGA